MLSNNEKSLIRRYLVWCYKTTKEDIDRIDRYFTQELVDDFVLNELESSDDRTQAQYAKMVSDFGKYKVEKIEKAKKQKFDDATTQQCQGKYLYLKNRLEAIEKAVVHFLSEDDLEQIQNMYEQEMTQRILSAREHA